jgi:hypothetical protein
MNEALTKKARTLSVAKAPLEQLPALWADDAVSDAKNYLQEHSSAKAHQISAATAGRSRCRWNMKKPWSV